VIGVCEYRKRMSRIRSLLSGGDATPAFAGSTISESQALRFKGSIPSQEADASTPPCSTGQDQYTRLILGNASPPKIFLEGDPQKNLMPLEVEQHIREQVHQVDAEVLVYGCVAGYTGFVFAWAAGIFAVDFVQACNV